MFCFKQFSVYCFGISKFAKKGTYLLQSQTLLINLLSCLLLILDHRLASYRSHCLSQHLLLYILNSLT